MGSKQSITILNNTEQNFYFKVFEDEFNSQKEYINLGNQFGGRNLEETEKLLKKINIEQIEKVLTFMNWQKLESKNLSEITVQNKKKDYEAYYLYQVKPQLDKLQLDDDELVQIIQNNQNLLDLAKQVNWVGLKESQI
ncbi:hypothetical protein PPERSA_00811 [Pseudocohnilembus persalinus]|uniref:Uncharacterized protein n=1 Tax=Pseudocohnilembus persalinus TaxID=266149 RepID=A0A0V0QFV5_PSEPJ|nr:hypothetical protein PPERSA_00811 [Pseudocohnilembus persalinus]|eukprot:KRX01063.1 hypothetical protein PPERSA_00811 [Pseudocohnilembus persalinus]